MNSSRPGKLTRPLSTRHLPRRFALVRANQRRPGDGEPCREIGAGSMRQFTLRPWPPTDAPTTSHSIFR